MKVTPTIIERIARRLRDPNMPKMNQSDIARRSGMGRAWVSKLMTGQIKELKEDHAAMLEEILGIRFHVLADNGARVADPALRASKLMQDCPVFRDAFLALVDLGESIKTIHAPRYVPTCDMNALGRKIAKLSSECGEKHGKLAAQVLALLTDKESA